MITGTHAYTTYTCISAILRSFKNKISTVYIFNHLVISSRPVWTRSNRISTMTCTALSSHRPDLQVNRINVTERKWYYILTSSNEVVYKQGKTCYEDFNLELSVAGTALDVLVELNKSMGNSDMVQSVLEYVWFISYKLFISNAI